MGQLETRGQGLITIKAPDLTSLPTYLTLITMIRINSNNMKRMLFALAILMSLSMPLVAAKKDPNGKHRREGYLRDNGKPCPCPDKPCAWRGRCVGKWEHRPCGVCPAPDCTPCTVNSTVLMVPTTIEITGSCVTTEITTIVPTVACTTFVIPGADNRNCRGERNNMVEELINKYARSDALVFLNGQEIEIKGVGVISGTAVVKTGVVTVTGVNSNAASTDQSMAGTLCVILLMAVCALFI